MDKQTLLIKRNQYYNLIIRLSNISSALNNLITELETTKQKINENINIDNNIYKQEEFETKIKETKNSKSRFDTMTSQARYQYNKKYEELNNL